MKTRMCRKTVSKLSPQMTALWNHVYSKYLNGKHIVIEFVFFQFYLKKLPADVYCWVISLPIFKIFFFWLLSTWHGNNMLTCKQKEFKTFIYGFYLHFGHKLGNVFFLPVCSTVERQTKLEKTRRAYDLLDFTVQIPSPHQIHY